MPIGRQRDLCAIAYAEPPAEIEIAESVDAVGAETLREAGKAAEALAIRGRVEDLAPDVHRDALEPEAGVGGHGARQSRDLIERDAELDASQPGRDVRVRLGGHVRIHADPDRDVAGGLPGHL